MHNFLNEALEGGGHDWNFVVQTCEQKLRDWDQSTFRQEVFLPIDLERNRSILISSHLPDDVLYWNGSKDGEFRVRDAYRMEIMEDRASSSNGADPIWNKIWKLKVPPKVRLFVWRACWDILPHNCNLAKRRVKSERGCVRCGMEEDSLHILRDCCWTKKIWEGKRASWCKLEASSFREWLAGVSSENKNGELEAMDIYRSPEACCMKALDMLQEYQKANDKLHQTKGRTDAKWQPPDDGVIKRRVKSERGCVRCGMEEDSLHILRDCCWTKKIWEGKRASWCKLEASSFREWLAGVSSENKNGELEAMDIYRSPEACCMKALDMLQEYQKANDKLHQTKGRTDAKWQPPDDGVIKGYSKINVEGDALVVIQALQRRAKRSGPVQLLVEDAIALSSHFDSLSFGFCFRDCNQAAHRLAKWATSSFCDEVWYEGGPPWIYDIVLSDYALINE
ncbi:hypothetical protein RDABS01_029701 [Bienertia sinuspersici]